MSGLNVNVGTTTGTSTTSTTDPAPSTDAAAIVAAIDRLAFQMETATMLQYLAMPYRNPLLADVAKRLNLPAPGTGQV